LLTTEIIPLCLRIMETGSELSRTVATFIVQKACHHANCVFFSLIISCFRYWSMRPG
jgi:hypothetical protein